MAEPTQGRRRPSDSGSDSGGRPSEKKPRLGHVELTSITTDSNGAIGGEAQASSVAQSALTGKKEATKKSKRKNKFKSKRSLPEPCSAEDVIFRDVSAVLGQEAVDQAMEDGVEWQAPFEFKEEVEVEVIMMSSNGEALATPVSPRRPWVVVVPFALPGEKIRARIYRHSLLHSFADLVSVETPNPELRDNERVRCQYFGKCAGCQYQMLSYDTQLDLKRNVVVKAYNNFSDLPPSSIPPILSTIPSPLQYGYRTKITPHFEAAPKKLQKMSNPPEELDWLKIGFNQIGTRHTMDIEECPIATPTLNAALGPIRENVIKNAYTYKRGVSLLLRDSLEIPTKTEPASETDMVEDLAADVEKHVCVTDHKATVRERVGDMIFEYPGGSFFQNNNSVLVPLTNYVRECIFPPASPAVAVESSAAPTEDAHRPTHLVDAYCGSGLFSLTLSPHFSTVAGIELSADSIRAATHNAALNGALIPAGKCTFRAGDAADIFAVVQDFPRAQTVLVIDPPRKGCDDAFVEQLVRFACATVVYVSCNVHTQARDVGKMMRLMEQEGGGRKYVLESLRGFDLFPQTAHVESVAVLRLV